jgi:hypothetical protein
LSPASRVYSNYYVDPVRGDGLADPARSSTHCIYHWLSSPAQLIHISFDLSLVVWIHSIEEASGCMPTPWCAARSKQSIYWTRGWCQTWENKGSEASPLVLPFSFGFGVTSWSILKLQQELTEGRIRSSTFVTPLPVVDRQKVGQLGSMYSGLVLCIVYCVF